MWGEDNPPDVVAAVYRAQRHAARFSGPPLVAAARQTSALAQQNGWALLAADGSGERIIGVASALADCPVADPSRRLDGVSVLLVAGVLAGPHGLAEQAAAARSLGATRVLAAAVGGWPELIPGCERVYTLTGADPMVDAPPAAALLSA